MTKSTNSTARYVYSGTYTAPHSAPGAPRPATGKGIAIYRQSGTGELALVDEVATENPSSLAMHPNGKTLYAVNELGVNEDGAPIGSVTAFAVGGETGRLSELNRQQTEGGWPCHCSVHPSGRYLFAANYGTGEFPVFPILPDGRLGPMVCNPKGSGCGMDPARQTGPHAHMILTDPSASRVYGVDLGLDRVMTWVMDESSGELKDTPVPGVQVASGAGPRHMAFHSDGGSAFVLNELSSTIDVFSVNPDSGAFVWCQTISSLPADSDLKRPNFSLTDPGFVPAGTNTGAEIRLHPNGKWLYVTNRGMNSVAQFKVDSECRELSAMNWTDTHGECPRGMIIDPDGKTMIVGNQNSDNIAVFLIDPSTGGLGEPIQVMDAPTPVDFAFGPEA